MKIRMLLAGVLAMVVSVLACGGCGATPPTVTSSGVQTVVTDTCELVGLLDPSGATAATVCENLAPTLAPIIAQVATAIGAAHSASAGGPMQFVPLKHAGATVGYVRIDLAAQVQSKLDATK